MSSLKIRDESRLTLAALALLMAFTRFSHEGGAFALPDASLAVFFLGGLYFGIPVLFGVLMVLASAIDYVAIVGLGVSDYCVSPAYIFLLPTYAVMWLAGRSLCRLSRMSGLAYGVAVAVLLGISASLAFVISNASFFWFSGKVGSLAMFDYVLGLSDQYFPYVASALGYAALGLGVEWLLCRVASIRLGGVNA